MSEPRTIHRAAAAGWLLVGALIVTLFLPACGTKNNTSSVTLEATAVDTFFGAFSFSYPAGWDAPLLDAPPGAHTFGWLEFVPPGETNQDVYILYSRGYEGLPTFYCSLEAAQSEGQSFKSWGDCIIDAMKKDGGYESVSHREANGGKIQIIEAIQGNRHNIWAFVFTTSFTGTITIGALTYSATPDKFDQYRPQADEMMSSFRAKS